MTTRITEDDINRMVEFEAELLDMPIEEATDAKWKAGNEKWGPDFIGNAAAKLHGEAIDSLNYIDKLAELGCPESLLEEAAEHAIALVYTARAIENSRPWGKKLNGTG